MKSNDSITSKIPYVKEQVTEGKPTTQNNSFGMLRVKQLPRYIKLLWNLKFH
jgi:hypothetical protein